MFMMPAYPASDTMAGYVSFGVQVIDHRSSIMGEG